MTDKDINLKIGKAIMEKLGKGEYKTVNIGLFDINKYPNFKNWRDRYKEYLELHNNQEIKKWLVEEKRWLIKELDNLDNESDIFKDKRKVISFIDSELLKIISFENSSSIEDNQEKRDILLENLMADRIDEVIKEIIIIAKSKKNEDAAKNISLQGNRWTTLKKNILNNLVSYSEISIEKNRIVVAIYEIILSLFKTKGN